MAEWRKDKAILREIDSSQHGRPGQWEGNEFECRYDPDCAGFDYEGYAIILRNKAGEIAKVKGSDPHGEGVHPALLKARRNRRFEKDFSSPLSLRSTFGLPGTR